MRVCDRTSSSASYISDTVVASLTDDMAQANLLDDPTDRFSTTPTCHTVASTSPEKPIDAPNVFFRIYVGSASDEIDFGDIEAPHDDI